MTLRRPRLITFDAFGTLFRTEGVVDPTVMGAIIERHDLGLGRGELAQLWWDRSYQIAFEDFVTVREATRMALASLFREFGVEDDAKAYSDRLLEAWKETDPYPEAVDALRSLGEFDLGIVSNIDDDVLGALLQRSGWADRFRVVVTSEATQIYKPEPGIFREALRRAERPAEQAIHLGDSPVEDVAGAKRSGMMAGWINREDESRGGGAPEPDFAVADLREAAELILATKPAK
ncbi:MAG: HAD-IA family hydrolase [Thermoplasmata archaeon]